MEITAKILLLTLEAFSLNIVAGMWRYYVPKKSGKWFIAIHLPVLFVIATRFSIDIPFVWYSIVLTVSFSVAGQFLGSYISRVRERSKITSN